MNVDLHVQMTGKMGELGKIKLKNLKTKQKMEESELPKSERIQRPQIKNNEYLKMYRMKNSMHDNKAESAESISQNMSIITHGPSFNNNS